MKRFASAFFAAVIVALAAPAMADKTAGTVVDDNTVNASVKAALLEAKGVPSSQIVAAEYFGIEVVFVVGGHFQGSRIEDGRSRIVIPYVLGR